ncbi:epididymal-specific lipocalin-5-like [Tamandua tetradactyla]|uniref:epididymal-specific lipocalin-5-like n=1 Tax=Tamandua tetradactyla TaxID=48850 RepID=UPI0040544C97
MAGRLLAGLLGICVALGASAQDTAPKDFDFSKFSGQWYEIAVASDVIQHFPPGKAGRLGGVLVRRRGQRLELLSVHDSSGSCVRDVDEAVQTGTPGRFEVHREMEREEVLVLTTDYTTYAVLELSVHRGAETQKAMKLYSRNLRGNQEAIKKFQEVAAKHGFSDRDIHLFDPDNTCLHLLNS